MGGSRSAELPVPRVSIHTAAATKRGRNLLRPSRSRGMNMVRAGEGLTACPEVVTTTREERQAFRGVGESRADGRAGETPDKSWPSVIEVVALLAQHGVSIRLPPPHPFISVHYRLLAAHDPARANDDQPSPPAAHNHPAHPARRRPDPYQPPR